jgi:putative hydrolase of the HAD superfamily
MMKFWYMDLKVDSNSVICFDLDDTLYNEIDYLKSAYQEIAIYVNPDDWLSTYGMMFSLYRAKKDVFEYMATQYTTSKLALVEKYRNHLPTINLFEGVKELLLAIKAKGAILCIITDGRSTSQRNKLTALGIIDFFDAIVISEEIGSEKPSKKNYLEIERLFPQKTYTYIADNLRKDFIVPNLQDWHSIALLDNGKNIHNTAYEYLKKEAHSPKALITDLRQLSVS